MEVGFQRQLGGGAVSRDSLVEMSFLGGGGGSQLGGGGGSRHSFGS